MKRTTIFLDDKLLRALKKVAYGRGVSFATVVREAMAAYIAQPAAAGALPSVTGRFSSGRSDTAEQADDLLWKEPHS